MDIKVVVNNTARKSSVSLNSVPKSRVQIGGSSGASGTAISTLRGLNDVIATSLDNNDSLIYDAASDRFIVKEIPIIKGGTF